MKIKVCGLTKPDQIEQLIDLKTDFLGFIFYPKSSRYVLNHLNADQISVIPHSGKVGVFVNETVENIVQMANECSLNYIQLHGDEDENYIDKLRNILNKETMIIKVFRIGQHSENLKSKIQNLKFNSDYLLFDTDSESFGGTGKTFDWQILNDLEIAKPYFLSGGISLENIDKLTTVKHQPFALDINSKFETEPGVKDIEKIKQLYEKLQKS